MQVSLSIKVLFVGALVSATAIWIWRSNVTVVSHSSSFEVHQNPTGPRPNSAVLRASPESASSVLSAPILKVDLRAQFRESRNYADFVRGLAGTAATGDPIAQYLMARALKYCNDSDNLHKGFRNSNGSLRTRNEVEIRVAKYPLSLQQENLDAYDRCQGFSQDGGQADATNAWASWLDKAYMAGYPPAQSLKAEVARNTEVMRDAANATSGEIIPPPVGPSRDLALGASLSGDPESIIEMMNWVDGTKRSGDDYWALSSAWGLLACQRGYDGCGPTSPWLRGICSWDTQCADDSSVIDMLKRQFGSRFDDVQNLANSIGLAIDQKDQRAVESFL